MQKKNIDKIIAVSDLHIRYNRPIHRIDEYFETICFKFQQLLSFSKKYKSPVFVAGDFFDSAKVPHRVVNTIIKLIKDAQVEIYTIAGQHDMFYHSLEFTPTPLKTLILSNCVKLLRRDDPIVIGGRKVYGVSYGEKIKRIHPREKAILVIHKTITPGTPPHFLKEAISAEDFMQKYKGYEVVISGDYHVPFTVQLNKRILINCGSMMRIKIDQTEHRPRAYLIDLNKKHIKKLYFKIQPAEQIFSLNQKKEKDDSISEELQELIDNIKEENNRPDFETIVYKLLSKIKKEKVVDTTKEILDYVKYERDSKTSRINRRKENKKSNTRRKIPINS